MENGGGIGLWLAHGAIGLFLVLLAVVVLRTGMLYGSLVLMSLLSCLQRRAPAPPAADAPPRPDPAATPDAR